MKWSKFELALATAYFIFSLITVGFIGFFMIGDVIEDANVEASSTWTQTAAQDFENGTFDNVTLSLSGEYAELGLDKDCWAKVDLINNPDARDKHAMAPIWGTDKVLLFGGCYRSPSYTFFNDTWIYDLGNNTWTNKMPPNSPDGRFSHALASVWGTDKVVLFGGYANRAFPDSYLNETWVYDLSENNWTQKTPTKYPEARQYHAMASIYGNKKILLLGGTGLWGATYNDTWIYNLNTNTWTKNSSFTNPYIISGHSLASINNTDKVILFGGFGTLGTLSNKTWIFDLSDDNWTEKTPSKITPIYNPRGRELFAMASIYGTDNIVLFGGYDPTSGPTIFGDTWTYDFSENKWIEIMSTNHPAARCNHAMASIHGTDKVLLFGGLNVSSFCNDTWIFNYSKPYKNGTYVSIPYEIGPHSTLKDMSWDAIISGNTSIKFQLRTATTRSNLSSSSFIGPDGNTFTYYLSSPASIWSGHKHDSWIQYKVYFYTKIYNETPRLKKVTISYNHWPTTSLVSPGHESIINNNKPTFIWDFIDSDSENQTAFQVLISNNDEFTKIIYNSNEQNSPAQQWQFPNGTSYNELPDGTWYWKVRTKDNDGDWGSYSSSWKTIIDSTPPNSNLISPKNNTFYNDLDSIFGIALDPLNGIGLDKVEVSIKNLDDNTYWNSFQWVDGISYLLATGTNEWSYDVSNIRWSNGDQYLIQSLATDNATNVEIQTSGSIVTFDKENVAFSNPRPSITQESKTEVVEVGILISDDISGVNASSIQYTVSIDGGINWGAWLDISDFYNGSLINVTLNITFPNGTNNYIKWRASDIAGNGPIESMEYIVRVNTWSPDPVIPKVMLRSPWNGSILTTTEIELSWQLMNKNLLNVSYDIYLDDIFPPNKIYQLDFINASIIIEGLKNRVEYYWMVIPRVDLLNGTCLSGVWSFAVEIPVPKVNLLSPEKGSIVQSTKPMISWSVEYDGVEIITFDLYLDTYMVPKLKYEKLTISDFIPNTPLEENKTYYWKVVPWAGDLKGLESEIWSFTVEKDEIPRFDLELRLEPSVIELKPGSIKYVSAYVTNLGDLTDSISVYLITQPNIKLGIFVGEPRTRYIVSGDNADFNLTIVTLEDAKKGEVIIEVVASSNKAMEYDLVLEKQEKLTVRILDEEKADQEKASYLFVFLNILILIIIIIIILALAIYIHKRKKKDEEEQEKATHEVVMVKPGELPTTRISISSAPEPEQLPKTTEPEKVTPVISPEAPKPQLPGTIPEPGEPGGQQTPQLPPGDTKDKENDAEETSQVTRDEISTTTSPQESKNVPIPPNN